MTYDANKTPLIRKYFQLSLGIIEGIIALTIVGNILFPPFSGDRLGRVVYALTLALGSPVYIAIYKRQWSNRLSAYTLLTNTIRTYGYFIIINFSARGVKVINPPGTRLNLIISILGVILSIWLIIIHSVTIQKRKD